MRGIATLYGDRSKPGIFCDSAVQFFAGIGVVDVKKRTAFHDASQSCVGLGVVDVQKWIFYDSAVPASLPTLLHAALEIVLRFARRLLSSCRRGLISRWVRRKIVTNTRSAFLQLRLENCNFSVNK